jgi:hypothetical protein
MKESFVFFRSFFEAIEEIDEKKQLKLYKSIANFALNGEKPTDLKGIEKAIFSLIEPQITASSKRYEVSKKCGEYGKLGGRPKKEKTLKGFENETLNVNDNVNVNVNDNENVNVNVNREIKKTDPYINPTKTFFISEYQKVFNTKPYLSNSDCIRLTELSSEYPEIREIIPTAISKLKKISFDDINFKPTASWLLKSNNFERVMNGEFDTEDDNSWLDDWVKEGA